MKKDFKVLISSESIGNDRYGVAQVLLQIIAFCERNEIDYRVVCMQIGDLPERIRQKTRLITIPPVLLLENLFSRMFRWSPKMNSIIREEILEFQPDLIHIHGVFTPLQQITQQEAEKKRIPVLLSPHGMLEPWTWNQRGIIYRLLKRSYWNLFLRPRLRRADYIHAITSMEADNLAYEFPESKQVLIPNSLDLTRIPYIMPGQSIKRNILFLGRIHPKKGVHKLVEAFYQAGLEDWKLLIAGPNFSQAYSRKLIRSVSKFKLEHQVEFLGPVYGPGKYQLMANSWIVVVPSSSEVVGLVNLEAAAVETPTITTHATGLYDWEVGGGLLVESNPNQIGKALLQASKWTISERKQRGILSKKLIQDKYSWQATGPLWERAYQKITSTN